MGIVDFKISSKDGKLNIQYFENKDKSRGSNSDWSSLGLEPMRKPRKRRSKKASEARDNEFIGGMM